MMPKDASPEHMTIRAMRPAFGVTPRHPGIAQRGLRRGGARTRA